MDLAKSIAILSCTLRVSHNYGILYLMKKILVVLVVLVLIAPAIGYCCDCHVSRDFDSGRLGYQNPARNCCVTLDIQKNPCEIEKTSEILPASGSAFIPLFSVLEFVSLPVSTSSAISEFGPPGFFSDIPVYLAVRSLRL